MVSRAAVFDPEFYLLSNNDVAAAVDNHLFSSGLEHFGLFGGVELRAPNELFVPSEYLELNADVAAAFDLGVIKHPFLH